MDWSLIKPNITKLPNGWIDLEYDGCHGAAQTEEKAFEMLRRVLSRRLENKA